MEDDETDYIEIYNIVDTEDEDDEGVDNKENANDLHKTEIERSSIKNELNNYSCPQIKLEKNTPVVGEDDDSEEIEVEIEESDEDVQNELKEIMNKHKNAFENHYGNKQEIKHKPLDEDAAIEEEDEEDEEEEEIITVLEILSDDETVDYDKPDEESDLLKPKDNYGAYCSIFHPPKSKSNVNDNIPSTSRSSRNAFVPTSTPPNKKARLSFNPSEDSITSSIKTNKEAFECVNKVLKYFQGQKDVEAVRELHKLQVCFCDRN